MAKKSVPNSASSPSPKPRKPKPAVSPAKQEQPSSEAIAILAVQLQILATLRDPKTAACNWPGTTVREAAWLIKSVPEYLVPQFEELSIEEMRRYFKEREASEEEQDSEWNLDHSPQFTFFEAVNQDWCRHKTPKRLWAFMKGHGYPQRHYPKLLTIGAYQVAEKKAKAAERESERLRKEKARSLKEKKAKSTPDKPHRLPDKNA